MLRKKRNRGLSEEVSVVPRSSPNLKPCGKFRKVWTVRFVVMPQRQESAVKRTVLELHYT